MLSPHILYCRGQERLEVYLYSPLRPVQRLSVFTRGYRFFPVVNTGWGFYAVPSQLLEQWSRKSISIPLHPLRLVQSVSASTRGYRGFPVVNSGRGGYAIPSHLLVPWSRKNISIHLHLLRSVEPQCLYKGVPALPRGK
jgi:hypothetical protein